MALNPQQIVQTLLAARMRVSAAVWMIVRDAQAAEDIFQDVSVKALAADVQFDREPQLVSASEGYFVTRDGGTAWSRVAPYFAPPGLKDHDGKDKRGIHKYYGWDSERNILYTSCFMGNVWKLQLESTSAAK